MGHWFMMGCRDIARKQPEEQTGVHHRIILPGDKDHCRISIAKLAVSNEKRSLQSRHCEVSHKQMEKCNLHLELIILHC